MKYHTLYKALTSSLNMSLFWKMFQKWGIIIMPAVDVFPDTYFTSCWLYRHGGCSGAVLSPSGLGL